MTSETLFQSGTTFPSIAGAALCFRSQEVIQVIQMKRIKEKIVAYLEVHNKIRISDLAEKLDISPRIIGQALNELEEEGLIKDVD